MGVLRLDLGTDLEQRCFHLASLAGSGLTFFCFGRPCVLTGRVKILMGPGRISILTFWARKYFDEDGWPKIHFDYLKSQYFDPAVF